METLTQEQINDAIKAIHDACKAIAEIAKKIAKWFASIFIHNKTLIWLAFECKIAIVREAATKECNKIIQRRISRMFCLGSA